MTDYKIVSYATEGSIYETCIAQQSALYGSRYIGLAYPDQGSWAANTKLKPWAIREALGDCDTVLWIDADCIIDAPHNAPAGAWDVGVIENRHPLHKNRISSGFILFRNTRESRAFLDHWDACAQHTRVDHTALTTTIKRMQGKVKIANVTKWLDGRHTINALLPERGEYAG